MTSQNDEELNKILNKAFDDIRKRVTSLIAKREKKIIRNMKFSTKHYDTQRDFKINDKIKKKDYHTKRSSSSDSSTS